MTGLPKTNRLSISRAARAAALGLFVMAGAGFGAAQAQDPGGMGPMDKKAMMMQLAKALPVPPPAGLFGVYMIPKAGKGVVNIGYTHVDLDGPIMGTNNVTPAFVATTVANPFFGAPGQPPFQRIIPTDLKVDVVKLAALYSVTDRIAVAGLIPYIRKDINAVTFAGPAGAVPLGTSNNVSKGIGDIKVGAVFRLYDDQVHHFLLDAIMSVPTGSITKAGAVLNPAGVVMPTRLFYGMQLGSGTWDPMLGLVYWGRKGKVGWGAQYLGTYRVFGNNENNWRFGNKHELTGWLSYALSQRLTISARALGSTEGKIKGMDPAIFGPAIGADTNNYGGEKLELFGGVNFMPVMGQNVSVEVGTPVYQDRNGVQLDHDWTAHATWRIIF